MLDQIVRVAKDKVMNPLIEVAAPLHPTAIAIVGFGFGIVAAGFAWRGWLWAGLACWLLNRIGDGLDGGVARLTNRVNDIGSHIDVMLDGAAIGLIVVGHTLGMNTTAGYIAGVFLLLAFRINATSWGHLGAILEKQGRGAKATGKVTSIALPSGLIEGTEVFVFLCLMYLLPDWRVWICWVLAALLLVTVAQRFVWAARNLDHTTT